MKAFACLLLPAALYAAQPRPAKSVNPDKAVDLTYTFDKNTIYWPTSKGFVWEKTQWGRSPGGYFYSSANFSANEHGGTHLDSPIHFNEHGQSVDQIPVNRLIGPAVVVDVSAECIGHPDALITAQDLKGWEKRHGRIPDGSIVLIRTGWGRYWSDRKTYLGTDKPGDVAGLHFPGLARDAAELIVKERKVNAMGIDTASVDAGQSKDFIVHQVLYGANIYGLENVANLDKLPAKGATLVALPMKIGGGTGAPVRIIALLP
jgi:kynurenine formamidase